MGLTITQDLAPVNKKVQANCIMNKYDNQIKQVWYYEP